MPKKSVKLVVVILVSFFTFNLLSLTKPGIAFAQENAPRITVCGDEWPPFTDPGDPNQGICFALTEAIFKSMNYNIEKIFLPPARTQKYVTERRVDAACQFWYNEKRAKVLLYSKPYLFNSVHFFVRDDSCIEYDTLKKLKGLTIGVIRNYYNGEDFDKAEYLTKYICNDSEQLLKMLVKGRIDMGVSDKIVAQTVIKRLNLEGKTKMLTKPLFKAGLHLVVGKDNPDARKIINIFNKGLEKVRKSGEYNRILKSYGVHVDMPDSG